nr:ABC transporter substrate-binding protein [Morganella psychrotolerans]
MTLSLQHPFYLSRYALLLAFLTLPFTAEAQKTISQEFSYGELPAPATITRIVSSGPPTDQLLFAVAPEKLAGFSSLFLRDEPLFAPQWRALPKLGRISGRGSTLSPESLLALAPDMIIDSGLADETYRSSASRFSRQTGIPYLLLSGNLFQTPDQLRRLGTRLGETARTEQQAQLAEKWLEDAQHFAARETHKTRFYLARGANGLQTGLRGSIHGEAPELLGFENVAEVPGMQGLADVSAEQLLQWNPDMIIAQDAVTYHAIMQGEVWQSWMR